MNDPQLIERLSGTDIYQDDMPLPETMRSDIVLLDIARRMDMDTMERLEVVKPPQPKRNGALIAAAAFAVVLIVGLAGALLTSTGGDTEPANPPTTVAPVVVDINAADPRQATNDQASRVTITFAGDAKALTEGAVHLFEIQIDLDRQNELNPGATVNYSNRDGVVTTTGSSPGGAAMTATWEWFADDGLLVVLRGEGIGIPDTRPEVVVRVQETTSADAVEFVMDTAAP